MLVNIPYMDPMRYDLFPSFLSSLPTIGNLAVLIFLFGDELKHILRYVALNIVKTNILLESTKHMYIRPI